MNLRNDNSKMLKIPEINQGNLYLLLPSKVSWLASMLVEYKGLSIVEAIKKVYASNLYKKLKIVFTTSYYSIFCE